MLSCSDTLPAVGNLLAPTSQVFCKSVRLPASVLLEHATRLSLVHPPATAGLCVAAIDVATLALFKRS